MQQDTPRCAKSFRTCRNVGSWFHVALIAFLTSRDDCIRPHVLLRCREQCNHLSLAKERSNKYQWFREMMNGLRWGIKRRLHHSNTNWKANKIVMCQLYWTLSDYIHLNRHVDQNKLNSAIKWLQCAVFWNVFWKDCGSSYHPKGTALASSLSPRWHRNPSQREMLQHRHQIVPESSC